MIKVSPLKAIDLKEIAERTKIDTNALKKLKADELKRIGNVIVEQIRERTRSGIGVTPEGKEYPLPSKPYTVKWAKKKGVARTAVDLTYTGDMLENMYVKQTTDNAVTIAIRKRDYGKLRGAEEGIPTVAKDARGNTIKTKSGASIPTGLVKRPFFNISEKDKDAISSNPAVKRILNLGLERLTKKK